VIFSAVPRLLNSVSIEPSGTTVAAARVRLGNRRLDQVGAFTFVAFTTTVAVCNSLGNAASMRL
jgi:hypothetical protein